MRTIKIVLLTMLAMLVSAPVARAALPDNWLSRLMHKRLGEKFPRESQRIDRIVADIQAEPKAQEFAAKKKLADAVKQGVEAARAREKLLQAASIGPTPAQAGAVKICELLQLEYPAFEPPPGK